MYRQDLNSCILAGSTRIVDHTTFAELRWTRDDWSPHFYVLPPGFQKLSHLLSQDFIAVLEDLNALRCIRDVPGSSKSDPMLMAHVNNHIASLQSRLVELKNLPPVLDCCRLAAYTCSIVLCCTIWCGLVIPVRCTQHFHFYSALFMEFRVPSQRYKGFAHTQPYSPSYHPNFYRSLNKKRTTQCGTIIQICYCGSSAYAGHTLLNIHYERAMHHYYVQTNLPDFMVCMKVGQM